MKSPRWLAALSQPHRQRSTWWITLGWLASSVIIYIFEARDALLYNAPLSGFFLLPALLGMLLLRPRAQFTLAGLTLLLCLHALLFLRAGSPISSGLEKRFFVRVMALGISCWGSLIKARLENATLLLNTIQRVSPVGMALIDQRRGTIVSVNPAMGELLACPPDDLPGQAWSDFDSEGVSAMAAVRRRLHRRDGDGRHVDVLARPLDGQGDFKELTLICAIDRQQSVEDEQALLGRTAELRQKLATSLKAAALAHEIRQPLSALILQCRQLQHQLEKGQTPAHALLLSFRQVLTPATELDATINAMAALLRSVSTEHHWLDLSAVVRSALTAQQLRLESLAVSLHTQGLDRRVQVFGDQSQLRIACSNLLGNAIDALQTRSPSERRLSVSLAERGDQVSLVIADNGPGFGELVDLERLVSHSSKPEGMGLGLFITETIATHHGGQLELGASSRLGGAEVRLNLPTLREPRLPRSDAGLQPAPAPHR